MNSLIDWIKRLFYSATGPSFPDLAGICDPLGARRYRIVAYCDPATMAPHPYTLQHECAHVLLFEAGVPHADHHARFRKAGIP